MSLPNSYTVKPNSIPDYFEGILNAEAPVKVNNQFFVNLDFKSTNDRMIIGILKELGFIDPDGTPKQRYYDFLDRAQSKIILANAIKEAYSDLFSINREAYKMSLDDVRNKFKTLYAGTKKEEILTRIASTFIALCEYADFTSVKKKEANKADEIIENKKMIDTINIKENEVTSSAKICSLQYHINIVLPESRDQAVYDAIFKSLRDHLG